MDGATGALEPLRSPFVGIDRSKEATDWQEYPQGTGPNGKQGPNRCESSGRVGTTQARWHPEWNRRRLLDRGPAARGLPVRQWAGSIALKTSVLNKEVQGRVALPENSKPLRYRDRGTSDPLSISM